MFTKKRSLDTAGREFGPWSYDPNDNDELVHQQHQSAPVVPSSSAFTHLEVAATHGHMKQVIKSLSVERFYSDSDEAESFNDVCKKDGAQSTLPFSEGGGSPSPWTHKFEEPRLQSDPDVMASRRNRANRKDDTSPPAQLRSYKEINFRQEFKQSPSCRNRHRTNRPSLISGPSLPYYNPHDPISSRSVARTPAQLNNITLNLTAPPIDHIVCDEGAFLPIDQREKPGLGHRLAATEQSHSTSDINALKLSMQKSKSHPFYDSSEDEGSIVGQCITRKSLHSHWNLDRSRAEDIRRGVSESKSSGPISQSLVSVREESQNTRSIGCDQNSGAQVAAKQTLGLGHSYPFKGAKAEARMVGKGNIDGDRINNSELAPPRHTQSTLINRNSVTSGPNVWKGSTPSKDDKSSSSNHFQGQLTSALHSSQSVPPGKLRALSQDMMDKSVTAKNTGAKESLRKTKQTEAERIEEHLRMHRDTPLPLARGATTITQSRKDLSYNAASTMDSRRQQRSSTADTQALNSSAITNKSRAERNIRGYTAEQPEHAVVPRSISTVANTEPKRQWKGRNMPPCGNKHTKDRPVSVVPHTPCASPSKVEISKGTTVDRGPLGKTPKPGKMTVESNTNSVLKHGTGMFPLKKPISMLNNGAQLDPMPTGGGDTSVKGTTQATMSLASKNIGAKSTSVKNAGLGEDASPLKPTPVLLGMNSNNCLATRNEIGKRAPASSKANKSKSDEHIQTFHAGDMAKDALVDSAKALQDRDNLTNVPNPTEGHRVPTSGRGKKTQVTHSPPSGTDAGSLHVLSAPTHKENALTDPDPTVVPKPKINSLVERTRQKIAEEEKKSISPAHEGGSKPLQHATNGLKPAATVTSIAPKPTANIAAEPAKVPKVSEASGAGLPDKAADTPKPGAVSVAQPSKCTLPSIPLSEDRFSRSAESIVPAYFSYRIKQKFYTDAASESKVKAETVGPDFTSMAQANNQAEALFRRRKEECSSCFATRCESASSKFSDEGGILLEGVFGQMAWPGKTSHLKVWVERGCVPAVAAAIEPAPGHTPFISATVYLVRVNKLIEVAGNGQEESDTDRQALSADDSDSDSSSSSSSSSESSVDAHDVDAGKHNKKRKAKLALQAQACRSNKRQRTASTSAVGHRLVRVHQPVPCTQGYTTLHAANNAAAELQIEMAHRSHPKNALDVQWKERNKRELRRKVTELDEKEGDEGLWKSEFSEAKVGGEKFEMVVERVRICGPRNVI